MMAEDDSNNRTVGGYFQNVHRAWDRRLIEGMAYSIPKHDLTKLREDWEGFIQVPFPAAAKDLKIDGVDLVLIHSKISDCIREFLRRGLLDGERENVLQDCVLALDRVVPSLVGDTAVFFEQLLEFGSAVHSEILD